MGNRGGVKERMSYVFRTHAGATKRECPDEMGPTHHSFVVPPFRVPAKRTACAPGPIAHGRASILPVTARGAAFRARGAPDAGIVRRTAPALECVSKVPEAHFRRL